MQTVVIMIDQPGNTIIIMALGLTNTMEIHALLTQITSQSTLCMKVILQLELQAFLAQRRYTTLLKTNSTIWRNTK